MKMVTIKANRYGGRKRVIGDEVEVTNRGHIKLVQALGWARPIVEEPPATPARAVAARQAKPAIAPEMPIEPSTPSADASAPPDPAKPKREYKRRDMTAEGAGS